MVPVWRHLLAQDNLRMAPLWRHDDVVDITQYVEHLRHQLAVAAEAGGADARALADRLTAPLDSAVRLTLLDALSAAADEITRDLAPGSVELRLRGGAPEFAVTLPPVDQEFEERTDAASEPPGGPSVPAPTSAPVAGSADEGAVSRINFRLPEQLKARIEAAAARERLSVNAWLTRVVAAALEPDDHEQRPVRRTGGRTGERYTGWVR